MFSGSFSAKAAIAAFVACAALAVLWWRAPGGGRPVNIVVVTMESARFGVLNPDLMPRTWATAARGTRFTQHRAVSAWTGANVVSLLTGVSPYGHGVHTRGQRIPEAWELPLDDLKRAGYRTAGLQGFIAVAGFGSTGLDLETPDDPPAWLDARAADQQPFFLWYHYLHTHLPYHPEPPYMPDWRALLPPGDAAAQARIEAVMAQPVIPAGSVDFRPDDLPAIRALYEANFRAFDDWFARFLAHLEAQGLAGDTIVVLTSDHGEEHLDHGPRVGHASTTRDGHLYEELVHVPMLLLLPPRLAAREYPPLVVDGLTDHLDLMPTLMRLVGVTPARPLAGRDMLRDAKRTKWSGVTSLAGFAEPHPDDLRVWRHAAIDWPWKLQQWIENGIRVEQRLFDLAADPLERDDRAASRPDIVAKLEPELADRVASLRLDAFRPELLTDAPTPQWRWPGRGGVWRFDDFAGRFDLEWAGAGHARHVVEYAVGTGAMAFDGRVEVDGTRLALGVVDRAYWDTFVLPYKSVRLRVGVAGRTDRWSDWLEIDFAR